MEDPQRSIAGIYPYSKQSWIILLPVFLLKLPEMMILRRLFIRPVNSSLNYRLYHRKNKAHPVDTLYLSILINSIFILSYGRHAFSIEIAFYIRFHRNHYVGNPVWRSDKPIFCFRAGTCQQFKSKLVADIAL